MKKPVKILLILLVSIGLVISGYILYLFIAYERIEDNLSLKIEGNGSFDNLQTETEYTIMTQNIGFGAYSHDYTFFMDGGDESRARSEEAVIENINGISKQLIKENPDILIFQEVDIKSTRSFQINEYNILKKDLKGFTSVIGVNYNSPYLFYPITEPHGKSLSSIVTFSKFNSNEAIRRSLPISTGISKFFDLDRCYTITTLITENGKKLQIYNVHLSAYGGSPEIRDGQINMLIEDINSDITSGDYVICGGDFNHDFTGDSVEKLNVSKEDFGWAQPFPDNKLSDNIIKAVKYNEDNIIPTTRNTDIPYRKGLSFVVILDGFLISSNIEYTYLENIDNGFRYTDHNPVKMKFILK